MPKYARKAVSGRFSAAAAAVFVSKVCQKRITVLYYLDRSNDKKGG
jgi:hypothetical protein